MLDYIHWLTLLDQHHSLMAERVRVLATRLTKVYSALATKSWWVVPFSLLAMLALSIAVLPVAIILVGYSWATLLVIKYDGPAYFLYRCGYRAYRWTTAFIGCAIMCLLVHVLFIALGLETTLVALLGK